MLRVAFRHRRACLAGAAVLAVLSGVLLAFVSVDANVLNLFPQEGDAIRAFQTYLTAFGRLDRVYLVVEAPPDRVIDDFETDIGAYVQALRAIPDVREVDDGQRQERAGWRYLLDRQLLLLDERRLDAVLARFRPPALDQALADARTRLTVPSSGMRTLVQEDPLDVLGAVRSSLAVGPLAGTLRASDDGYVSADGRARLIMLEPTQPPFNSTFARELNARLEAAARATLPALLTVQDAGGYRIAAESEAIIKTESWTNGLGSLAGILLLMTLVFRSLRPIVPILLPIVLASLATIAIYGTVRPLSVAAAGSAAILFGIGVDHTLLLYIRSLERRRAGDAEVTLPDALATAAGGIAIAVTTTAATFFGLLVVDLPALRDLGRVGGFGVLMCGVIGLLLLPALLPHWGSAAPRPIETPWLARLVQRRRRAILLIAAFATVVLAPAAINVKLTPTVDALAPPSRSAHLEREIAERFELPHDALFAVAAGGALAPLLDVHADLARAVRSRAADLDVIGVAHLLPPADVQTRAATRIAAAELDPGSVERDLTAAAARAGFRDGAFAPFVDRLPSLLDRSQRLTLEGYAGAGLGHVLSPFVAAEPGRFVTVSYLYPRTADAARVAADVVRETGGGLILTSVGLVNAELAARFGPEFLKGAVVGLAAVIVLVVAGFGSFRAGLWALAPVALGLLWAAGILGLTGVTLDLFSVFGVLMCVGIGVDYGVHLWHRQGQHGADGQTVALTRTAPAILLSGTTSMIGFGSLIASSYAPLHALGVVTTIAIGACLIAALLVVPAMQLGPPARFGEPG
jgi:predicted RND superfamily exporter protein